jgi:N-acetylglucosamine-6-phosphate deacetylase
VGLHLEGPFVALSGAACKTRSGDVDLMARYADACGGTLRAVSIAPEVENIIPVIEWLAERGVAVFITHTQADFDQTARAIDAGARHATHFYDVFYNPEPTDGGARPASSVEAILGDTRCTVDFIPDGVHVHPGVIRMAQTIKGPTGVCAITDSNIGAGLPDGVYPAPWGFPIEVGPRGGARNADPEHPHYGCLAGSVLQLDQAVNNLFDWLDQDDALTWAMATSNPAAVAHLENKGRLAPGGDADLVLWDCHDGRYQPAQTWVAGQRVWQSESVPG